MMSCFFSGTGDHRDLHVLTHSFPTRRSSDLRRVVGFRLSIRPTPDRQDRAAQRGRRVIAAAQPLDRTDRQPPGNVIAHRPRSEEHTSELQSLMRSSYAVFCLKKKTKTQTAII